MCFFLNHFLENLHQEISLFHMNDLKDIIKLLLDIIIALLEFCEHH